MYIKIGLGPAYGGASFGVRSPSLDKNFELWRISKLASTNLNCDFNIQVKRNMKRKNDALANGKSKKRAISDDEAQRNFRKGLFDPKVLKGYSQQYAKLEPYVCDYSSMRLNGIFLTVSKL